MSEKDKMLAGELYDANYDKELIKDRYKAKDICFEYNNLKPSDYESKDKIIKRLFAMLDGAKVEFGDNVFVAPNCGFYTAGHPLDYKIRNQGLEYAKPIKIGNNVWIGGNVVVLPGVTIGDNVVIGAGSVVNKDIPSDVVAVGNPCRVIKKN